MQRSIKHRHRQSRPGRRSGQTLIETALTLTTIMLPLSLGLIQYGIILNATQSLSQISREAGRYAAINGTQADSDAAIKDHVQRIAAQTTIRPADLPDANIVISMVDNKPRSSGNIIRVTITYPMAKKVILGNAVKILPGVSNLAKNYTVGATYVLE